MIAVRDQARQALEAAAADFDAAFCARSKAYVVLTAKPCYARRAESEAYDVADITFQQSAVRLAHARACVVRLGAQSGAKELRAGMIKGSETCEETLAAPRAEREAPCCGCCSTHPTLVTVSALIASSELSMAKLRIADLRNAAVFYTVSAVVSALVLALHLLGAP